MSLPKPQIHPASVHSTASSFWSMSISKGWLGSHVTPNHLSLWLRSIGVMWPHDLMRWCDTSPCVTSKMRFLGCLPTLRHDTPNSVCLQGQRPWFCHPSLDQTLFATKHMSCIAPNFIAHFPIFLCYAELFLHVDDKIPCIVQATTAQMCSVSSVQCPTQKECSKQMISSMWTLWWPPLQTITGQRLGLSTLVCFHLFSLSTGSWCDAHLLGTSEHFERRVTLFVPDFGI